MTSLHIVYIHETMGWGGAEIMRATVLRHMRRDMATSLRIKPTVVCLRGKGPVGELIAADGIQVIALDWRGALPSWRLWVRLTRLLRGLRPDIVHTCLYEAHRHGIPAAHLAGCKAILMEEHGLGEWMGRRERLYSRILARMATMVAAVSHAQAAHLSQFIPYPANRLVVIPNCIDPERLGGRPCFAPVRRDAAFLTSIGALREDKGYPLLLRAFQQVIKQRPACRLTIVGDGPLHTELERLIADLGLENKAILAGQSSHIREILSKTDVYVHAGQWEAFCLSLAEAMYAGCACVAPHTAVIKEVTDSGRLARLAPAGEAGAMAAAIVDLLDHAEARKNMGQAAAEHVAAHYIPRHHIARLTALYDELMDSADRAG